MKRVSDEWEQTNRELFVKKPIMVIDMYLSDGRQPLVFDSKILSLNYNKSGDLRSSFITQDTVTFTLDNRSGWLSYDADVNDVYKNTLVRIMPGFDLVTHTGNSIDGGSYYITSAEMSADKKKIQITAKTILSFLTRKVGAYSTTCAVIVDDILDKELNNPNLPGYIEQTPIEYVIDDSLSTIEVEISADDNLNTMEALQLIANACGCVLYAQNRVIYIVKPSDVTENYVLSNRLCFEFPQISYGERVSGVEVRYNHGESVKFAYPSSETEGGTQIITNPIITDNANATDVAEVSLDYFINSRKKVTANYRFDPRLELFDVIVIPAGNKVGAYCVTKINATYSGAWRGTIEAVLLPNVQIDLRICDIEMLTIEQLETMQIMQLHPNTISDIDGDYIATSNGELPLWKKE